RVAACVAAMRAAVAIPVTVKTRIGIDDLDSFAYLRDFAARLFDAGCDVLIVHARKAWLGGLSPKQNRTVPPLQPERVYRLKQALPDLPVVLNGGVTSLDAAAAHLAHVDGVMIGRAAYHDPYMLAAADRRLFGDDHPVPAREAVARAMIPYIETQVAAGVPVHAVTRHMIGLFNGVPGARAWRRHLSEAACRRGAGSDPKAAGGVIEAALAAREEAARTTSRTAA
ncbi:MAG: tRNA dihydrouridine(20/20a) synthase DusA, partial [Alphaproteobacteria bacterium]